MKNYHCSSSGSKCGIGYSRFQKPVLAIAVILLISVLTLPGATSAQKGLKKSITVKKTTVAKAADDQNPAKDPKAEDTQKPAPEVKAAAESQKPTQKTAKTDAVEKPAKASKTDADIKAMSSDEPIHIIADLAQHDRNKQLSEFIGNVKVTQGKSYLKTDRLQIYHKNSADPTKETTDAEEAIEKVMALGHVYVNFDNKVAVAEKAVYTTKTGVLVLSGKNTKVTTGKNSIAGKRITVYRFEDRITVEGGSKNRVEAVFYSDGKGLNLKSGFK